MQFSKAIVAAAVVCMIGVPSSMQSSVNQDVQLKSPNLSARSLDDLDLNLHTFQRRALNSIKNGAIQKNWLESKIAVHVAAGDANGAKKWQRRLNAYNSGSSTKAFAEAALYEGKEKVYGGDKDTQIQAWSNLARVKD